ncbi:hypothetical protein ACFFUA_00300 [Streptomyces heliomycini]|uniref:Uncharacterized protein n=1 Tax=Streptomyces heliomycini TaxID=284032 RepID=A0ABV5L3H5_9ACTN
MPALVTVLACETRAAVGTGPPVITAGSPASPATRPSAAVSLDRTVVGPFVTAALLGARDGERLAAKVSAPARNGSSRSSRRPWPPSCSPTR